MNEARTWLRRVVTVPGAHAFPQAALAEGLRRHLERVPGTEAVRALVDSVYARTGVRRRHLEADPETLGAHVDPKALAGRAAFSLGARTLETLLGGEMDPASVGALVVVGHDDAVSPELPAQLAERAGLPEGALTHLLTARDASGPAQAIFFAQMLLRREPTRHVAVVAVDVAGTLGHLRLRRGRPSISQVMSHAALSDGGAGLLLSREPGERPRLAYRDCTLTTRVWRSDEAQPSAGDTTEMRARVLEDLGAWIAAEQTGAPLLVCPGSQGLLRGDDPRVAEATALGREVLASHGRLQVASLLWILDRALEEDRSLAPDLRLVTLGPGVAATVLVMEGVERHVRP